MINKKASLSLEKSKSIIPIKDKPIKIKKVKIPKAFKDKGLYRNNILNKDMKSFIDLQAKKLKINEIKLKKLIDKKYELDYMSKGKLLKNMLKVRSSLTSFISTTQHLKRLIKKCQK
jgi:hypothetical protein